MTENTNLKPLNTFSVPASSRFFTTISSSGELELLFSKGVLNTHAPVMVLGGGSNLLFTRNFDGLLLKNEVKGISIIKEDNDHAWVKANSGEIWHDLVLFCIDKKLGGIENLSLIPGTVGAAPIQNIGAYGVELKDTFESLEAFDLYAGNIASFNKKECNFGYRDSIFKNEHKGRYFILSVTLKLSKAPVLHLSYGAISSVLKEKGINSPNLVDVSNAVISIRKSKLPDPEIIGNGGSFFKNPVVDRNTYKLLKDKYEDIPGFPSPEGVKIPAGWLIEKCGWKGRRMGNVGVHENQALVLVNYGEGNGKEVLNLSKEIQSDVLNAFKIALETEINII